MSARLPTSLLLVEDERIVAFDLKRQLQGFGYRVAAVVASGEQAVLRVAAERPDLVLMDIHLEGRMDGIEAAAEIRAKHRVPVVFLTAYAEDDTLRRALDSRPFGYLVTGYAEDEVAGLDPDLLPRVSPGPERYLSCLQAGAAGFWHGEARLPAQERRSLSGVAKHRRGARWRRPSDSCRDGLFRRHGDLRCAATVQAPGAPRPADRPAEPSAVRRPAGQRDRTRASQRAALPAAFSRSRRLQGDQRHVRPRGGRRPAVHCRRAPEKRAAPPLVLADLLPRLGAIARQSMEKGNDRADIAAR